MSMTTFNWNFFHRKFKAFLFISISTLLSPPFGIYSCYMELRGTTKNLKTKQNVVQRWLSREWFSYFALIYMSTRLWMCIVRLQFSPIFHYILGHARQVMLVFLLVNHFCFFFSSNFQNFQRENRTRNLITNFRCCGRECGRCCYLCSNAYIVYRFFFLLIILSNRLIPRNFYLFLLPVKCSCLRFVRSLSLTHTHTNTQCSRSDDVLPFGRSI